LSASRYELALILALIGMDFFLQKKDNLKELVLKEDQKSVANPMTTV
jgi:hypothetical protein